MKPFSVAAVGRSDPGLRYDHNEDSFHLGENLVVVADGIGGSVAGEVASRTVVDVFAGAGAADNGDDLYRILGDCVRRSTDAINDLVREDPDLDGMGTTATAMMWVADRIVVAQVGDSRAYYLPGRGARELAQITRDDSFVQYLVDVGTITAEQARSHPRRNVILQALNGMSVTPTFTTMAPLVRDRYLLCSDGLSDYVAHAQIERVVRDGMDREAAADELIDLALQAGAPDNVTVIIADVVPA